MTQLWICCQLGAREHYAIPRALHQSNQLQQLITDAWISPHSLSDRALLRLSHRLKDRFHPDLSTAPVQAFTSSLLQFEATQKLRKKGDWDRMIQRNYWFQQNTQKYLKANTHRFSSPPILFSYSYTALHLFRFAKEQGWHTVLGQIDPGPLEEKLVAEEQAKYPALEPNWHPVPSNYWETWQQECALADTIVVNSNWSKRLLEQAGVEPGKIRLVPLVYEPPPEAFQFTRTYPLAFTSERPLRVLFLGNITLRKGVAALLEAINLLLGKPIEFWLVGSQQITIPDQFQNHPQIHWVGQVPRSKAQYYYRKADLFLFPSLSDGFGLTQLEAQAWKLPIIASQFCGEVVKDQVNGVVLTAVTGDSISEVLQYVLRFPKQLSLFSNQALSIDQCKLKRLSMKLDELQVF